MSSDAIVQFLRARAPSDCPTTDDYSAASKHFGLDLHVVLTAWDAREVRSEPKGEEHKRKKRPGRPRKYTLAELDEKIRKLPPCQRTSIRQIARTVGMSSSTLWAYDKLRKEAQAHQMNANRWQVGG